MTTTTEQHQLDETAQRFLASLNAHGLVTVAAAFAGISTAALYKRRAKDEHFAALWEAAVEAARVRISAALKQSASDQHSAQELLAQVAERLKDPNLSSDDRATHMRHLEVIAARIEELRTLANSEAAKAHVRRRDEARAQLREDTNVAVAVAAEFDEAIKQLDPHWKRLLHALAAVKQRAIRAEVPAPEVAIETMVRCALYHHCPEFAAFLGVLRADRRHQQPFHKFVEQRMPEVRP